jgi:hypothetical protein
MGFPVAASFAVQRTPQNAATTAPAPVENRRRPVRAQKSYVRLAPPAELKLWSLRTETEIVYVEVCLPRPTLGLIQRSRRLIRNFSGECQTKGTNRPSETDRGRKQQRAHSHPAGVWFHKQVVEDQNRCSGADRPGTDRRPQPGIRLEVHREQPHRSFVYQSKNVHSYRG